MSAASKERIELVVLDGPNRGRNAKCARGERIVVGRAADAALSLFDLRLSRTHCEVSHDGETWVLRDLNSHNGTRLNDMPVNSYTALADEDVITAGDSRLRVVLSVRTTPEVFPASPHFGIAAGWRRLLQRKRR